jgi:hypothetical protein
MVFFIVRVVIANTIQHVLSIKCSSSTIHLP